ncbi:MAG: hypothetical protein ACLP1X_34790 [Polyangiaceae bacterium]
MGPGHDGPATQVLSSWLTQHVFGGAQGVVPQRGTLLSANAEPSPLASAPLDEPPADEDPPLLDDEEDDEEDELDPPLPAASGVLPPVEASEVATPLVLPPQASAERMTAAVKASAGGLTTITRGPVSRRVALPGPPTSATMDVVLLASLVIVVGFFAICLSGDAFSRRCR